MARSDLLPAHETNRSSDVGEAKDRALSARDGEASQREQHEMAAAVFRRGR